MLDLAIIASVVPERIPLLERSIITWQRSIAASGLRCAIYLWCNGAPLYEFMNALPETTHCDLIIGGTPERSGSHIKGYNHWFENCPADVLLFTHPEIMFPTLTVGTAYSEAQSDIFATFKVFWLPQHMTEHLDDYNWRIPECLEQRDALYIYDPKEHGPYYWNKDVRDKEDWQSTTTFAYDRKTASKIFPFPDLGRQGYDDPAHAAFRQHLGIHNLTMMDPILFHQWHPQLWNGNEQEAINDTTMLMNSFRARRELQKEDNK